MKYFVRYCFAVALTGFSLALILRLTRGTTPTADSVATPGIRIHALAATAPVHTHATDPRASVAPQRFSANAPVAALEATTPPRAAVPARDNFASAWPRESRPGFAAFKRWTDEYLVADPTTRAALEGEGFKLARTRRAELRDLIQSDPGLAIASAVPMTVRSRLPPTILAQVEDYVSGTGDLTLLAAVPAPGQSLVGKPYFRTASVNGKHYEAFVYGRRDLWQSKVDISILGIAVDHQLAVSESPLRVLEPGEIPEAGKTVNKVCPISGRASPISADAPLNEQELTAVEVAGEVKQLCSPAHVPFYEFKLTQAEAAAGPYSGALILGSGGPDPTNAPGDVPSEWTHGPKRLLIIRVDFSDAPGTPVGLDNVPITDDYAVNQFNLPNGNPDIWTGGIRDFYEQGSYGKTTLVIAPAVNGDSPDVTPVYRMPKPASYYATNTAQFLELEPAAHNAATTNGYSLTNYDRIGMVVGREMPAIPGAIVGYGGFGAVGGKNFSTYGGFGVWVVAHEIGHNYGLPHANRWQSSDGNPISLSGTSINYGDPFSIMGGDGFFGSGQSFVLHHFTHQQKSDLRWIPTNAAPTVEWSGVYRVHRFDHQNASLSNALALVVPRNDYNSLAYWIGYRQAITNNASLMNGAYVLWSKFGGGGSILLDLTTPSTNSLDAALPIGATLDDSEYGITITPLAKGGSSPNEYLDVQITLPGRIQWTTNTYYADDDNGSVTLTLVRLGESNNVISVNFGTTNLTAIAPDDYTATNGTITWAAGDISPKHLTIPLVQDFLAEDGEYFRVGLGDVSGSVISNGTFASVFILPHFKPQIQWSSGTFDEQSGAATVTLTLQRFSNTNDIVRLDFATADNTATAPQDYIATNGTIIWGSGDASPKTITIPLVADYVAEAGESFLVQLTGVAGGTLIGGTLALVEIAAQPQPRIEWSATNHFVEEQSGAATLTLLRSNNTNDIVSVAFATLDGTAHAPGDYTATNGTLLWGVGDSSPKSITVPLVKDFEVEGARRFEVTLSGINGGVIYGGATANVTILPEVAPAPFTLVKDINSQPNPAGSGTSPDLVAVSNTVFFVATDSFYGTALWRSDGTADGTVRLKTGLANGLVNVNGTLFFSFNDPATGIGLWKSDGTPGGTVLVKDVYPSSIISGTSAVAAVNGVLFFAGNDGVTGTELWRSDGTDNGTTMVKELATGSANSNPTLLTDVNGTLYFSADDGTNGIALWKSDGSSNGTVMVKDLRAGTANPGFANFTASGGRLFFTATDGTNGTELWISDGSPAGTKMAKDIVAGSGSSSPANLADLGGVLFFAATDSTNGVELWKSDGTDAGTEIVRNIRASSAGSSPDNLINVNGTLFFSANNGTSGIELWQSDGSSNGTVIVRDIRSGSGSSSPVNLANVNGTLYFQASTVAEGAELWRSDGTSNGTVMVKNINPGSANSAPFGLVNANGTLFFKADNGTNGVELWQSDGNDSGTMMVKDIEAGTLDSSPANLTEVNGTLFFTASNGVNGVELFKSDGTANGTVLVRDIYSGASSSNPGDLLNALDLVFFVASTSANGYELWRSDGTSSGTFLLRDIRAGTATSSPASLTEMNGFVYFSANDGTNDVELWRTDGTTNGTSLVRDIYAGASSSSPGELVNVNGTLYFSAITNGTGAELWKSDGTSSGTVLVKDIRAGATGSVPGLLTAVGETLFFRATDGTNGLELWKSDGTADGTVMVKNIQTGSSSSSPANLLNVNDTLFFTADSSSGIELWRSDGSGNGTVLVQDIFPGGTDSNPAELTSFNGRIFFTAADGTYGRELWISDGTSNSTFMVTDLNPSGSSNPTNLTVFNGRLFFLADDGVHGQELWTSDGTELGTFRLDDLPGDPPHTLPAQLVVAGRTLFLAATRVNVGDELQALFLNDYGDAPDPLGAAPGHYPTRLAQNGARHLIPTQGPVLYLGAVAPTGGFDASPNAAAESDLADDGVALPPQLNSGQTQPAQIFVAGSNGVLNAWVDWNRDGDWDDASEQVFTNQPVVAGTSTLNLTVPMLDAAGQSFARFRLSTASDLGPNGAAPDGEVEDYPVFLDTSLALLTLRITPLEPATFALGVTGPPNTTNRIEFTDALPSPTGAVWQSLGLVILDDQGHGAITNATSAGSRFYRAILP